MIFHKLVVYVEKSEIKLSYKYCKIENACSICYIMGNEVIVLLYSLIYF